MAVKAKRKKNTAWKAVVCVLLILLLLGGLFAVFRSCNITGQSFTFSLRYDGDKLHADTPFGIDLDTNYRVEVADPLGNALSDGSFTVKIVARPTDNENLYWRVDDMVRTIKDLPELTDYLLVEKGDNYFVLRMSLDFPEMLQDIYGDLKVTQAPSFVKIDTPIFNLVVTSATGSFSITVPLRVQYWSVRLSPSHIIF